MGGKSPFWVRWDQVKVCHLNREKYRIHFCSQWTRAFLSCKTFGLDRCDARLEKCGHIKYPWFYPDFPRRRSLHCCDESARCPRPRVPVDGLTGWDKSAFFRTSISGFQNWNRKYKPSFFQPSRRQVPGPTKESQERDHWNPLGPGPARHGADHPQDSRDRTSGTARVECKTRNAVNFVAGVRQRARGTRQVHLRYLWRVSPGWSSTRDTIQCCRREISRHIDVIIHHSGLFGQFEVWRKFRCWNYCCNEISRQHWITTQTGPPFSRSPSAGWTLKSSRRSSRPKASSTRNATNIWLKSRFGFPSQNCHWQTRKSEKLRRAVKWNNPAKSGQSATRAGIQYHTQSGSTHTLMRSQNTIWGDWIEVLRNRF